MVKLSELKNEDILLVGEDCVMTKEDYIRETQIQGPIYREVYTTKEYKANIDARNMLNNAIEYESDNMYEDWDYCVKEDVTEADIAELQSILDRILSRRKNTSYLPDEEVEIDI